MTIRRYMPEYLATLVSKIPELRPHVLPALRPTLLCEVLPAVLAGLRILRRAFAGCSPAKQQAALEAGALRQGEMSLLERIVGEDGVAGWTEAFLYVMEFF